jgi:hypothetical protein
MLYVMGYFLVSSVITGIIFLLIQHSPSGYEDENGFNINSKPAPQMNPDWVRSNRLRAGNAYRHAASLAE